MKAVNMRLSSLPINFNYTRLADKRDICQLMSLRARRSNDMPSSRKFLWPLSAPDPGYSLLNVEVFKYFFADVQVGIVKEGAWSWAHA